MGCGGCKMDSTWRGGSVIKEGDERLCESSAACGGGDDDGVSRC